MPYLDAVAPGMRWQLQTTPWRGGGGGGGGGRGAWNRPSQCQLDVCTMAAMLDYMSVL